ncbi:MAG: hypothetical protein RRA94_05885 [Bacteroidota bacterium]|nr:hypothetical protein [Bacteroidota bacterium]
MKRTIFLAIALLVFTAATARAQNQETLFTMGDTEVGLSLGTAARYTTIFDDDAGLLEFKGLLTFDRTWAVGLMGAGLWYDKSLHDLVDDGSYRIEMAYGGVVVERWFSLSPDVIFSLSVATGYGEVKYRYDREYRKDKIWTEESIDQTTFAFFEPGVALQLNLSGRLWLGVSGSYRNTAPVELLGTDENVFRKFSGGVTVTYGLF